MSAKVAGAPPASLRFAVRLEGVNDANVNADSAAEAAEAAADAVCPGGGVWPLKSAVCTAVCAVAASGLALARSAGGKGLKASAGWPCCWWPTTRSKRRMVEW